MNAVKRLLLKKALAGHAARPDKEDPACAALLLEDARFQRLMGRVQDGGQAVETLRNVIAAKLQGG
jgi:hypothetical protein